MLSNLCSETPVPYQQVEYLEQVDGKSYIDTGYSPNQAPILEVTFSAPKGASMYFIGADGSGNTRFSLARVLSSTRLEFRIGNYKNIDSDANFHVAKIDGTTGKAYLDNVVKWTSGYRNFNDLNILVFTSSYINSSTGEPAVRTSMLKGVKIAGVRQWSPTGKLLRNYVPVRDGEIGYLYDKVTRQLFGNENPTGAFGYGADLLVGGVET